MARRIVANSGCTHGRAVVRMTKSAIHCCTPHDSVASMSLPTTAERVPCAKPASLAMIEPFSAFSFAATSLLRSCVSWSAAVAKCSSGVMSLSLAFLLALLLSQGGEPTRGMRPPESGVLLEGNCAGECCAIPPPAVTAEAAIAATEAAAAIAAVVCCAGGTSAGSVTGVETSARVAGVASCATLSARRGVAIDGAAARACSRASSSLAMAAACSNPRALSSLTSESRAARVTRASSTAAMARSAMATVSSAVDGAEETAVLTVGGGDSEASGEPSLASI